MLYYGILFLNCAVCVLLIVVVLLQRSEGGALGGGGSPTGLVTTRGAGDLLTRTTWVLFALFLSFSLALTLLGGHERSSQEIINRLKLQSINPDTLPARSPAAPGSASPATPPAQPANPSQLAAPKPTVRVPSSQASPSTNPSTFSTPAPVVALPPLQGPPAPPKP